MNTSSSQLDLVLVGRKYPDISEIVSDAQRSSESAATYRHVKANTVRYHGKRISYMDLLNVMLTKATGKRHFLHMAELPALGPAYLTSFLRRRNFNVELVNTFNVSKKRLVKLLDSGPLAVAISTTFYFDGKPIQEMVKFIRERNPEVKIIVGGPHIYNVCTYYDTLTQSFLFKSMGADIYIFESQGELTLSRVLEQLRRGSEADLASVPNIIYRNGLRFARTERVIEDNSLDDNWVDWSTFDQRFYSPTTLIRTARSCPFRCEFCSYPFHAGAYVLTSPNVAEMELRKLHDAGVRTLIFTNDTINVPLPQFKDFCRTMAGFEFKWFSHFRCAQTDDETFDLMRQSGCLGVDMGIESGDWTILRNMNKRVTPDKYRYAIPRLRDNGVITYADLLVGFPGETNETVQNTIDFMNQVAPQFYHAEVYIHLPTTPIARHADEYGIRGGGYSWSHDTMDWREACEQLERLYGGINASTILPRQNFGSFTLPYLLGKGMQLGTYEKFLQVARRMTLASMDDTDPAPEPFEAEFTTLLAGERLSDPAKMSDMEGYDPDQDDEELAPVANPRPQRAVAAEAPLG